MSNVVPLVQNGSQRDQASEDHLQSPIQPYTICKKRLYGAYAAELMIAATAFAGSALLAHKYSSTSEDFYLMLLAPLVYVVVELSRVPLAISIRTHPSHIIKIIAILGVICAAGITIKSVSQLGEMMFHPRLSAVAEAKRNANEAHDALKRYQEAISKATELVDQRKVELAITEDRLKSATAGIGSQPGQSCNTVTRNNKEGIPYKVQICTKNPATIALSQQLVEGTKSRSVALSNLNDANANLKSLEDPSISKAVTTAETNLKNTVFNSQIHAFTAMVFGIDPLEVNDGQVHLFLRIFVFIPAILAAIASTLLAMTSVTPNKAATSPDYRLTAEESHRVLADALTAAERHINAKAPVSQSKDTEPLAA